ncbi:MAG: xanthine dehydrogenase family protein molybdopterin-binding subunit [Alphaproteobacteria bacterium]|nr:xanthine dehydrogenase family protein molybdopterin-binding subunit [Alphaproteobacteria bacterium]
MLRLAAGLCRVSLSRSPCPLGQVPALIQTFLRVLSEVEVDLETGLVEVIRYASVDDCGLAVNPLLIHGQSHGGIAQGIGQALWEQCVYDPRSGQLLSGSLLDYALPRADLLPGFDTEISEVPSTTNPLGMRGGSEGGITPAAVIADTAPHAPFAPERLAA